MEIASIVLLCVVVALLLVNILQFRYNRKELHSISVRTAYIVEHIASIRKDTDTLGKVMTIYENETKIIQKKKEQDVLKQRFQRQPR
jgi:hypothetical protein